MKKRPYIKDKEFKQRVIKVQEKMEKENLDILLTFGNEAEPQFIRYFSNYWPSFETAAVLIPRKGQPYLLIGPESETFANRVSKIDNVRRILYLRESSEPDYPGSELSTFESVLEEVINDTGLEIETVGIAGYSLITKIVYDAFEKSIKRFTDKRILRSDNIVNELRVVKSEDELACLEYAYDIAKHAMEAVVSHIKVGVTENELKGYAMQEMFSRGAEAEGYPFWIITGNGSNQPVARIRNAVVEEGDLIQIQVSARYEGYVSTLGRPVVVGEVNDYQRGLIHAGYEVQKAILELAKPGLNARKISEAHYQVLKNLGYEKFILYGPVHGTGLAENESPWIEEHSDYILEEGMTFCTCLYLGDDEKDLGIRVEDGFVITKNGSKLLTDYKRELISIQ